MSLWYLMLTKEQSDRLNEIFCPLYSPYPYVPVATEEQDALFPWVDDSPFGVSEFDPRLSTEDQDYIILIKTGRKTYQEAIAAGWIPYVDD